MDVTFTGTVKVPDEVKVWEPDCENNLLPNMIDNVRVRTIMYNLLIIATPLKLLIKIILEHFNNKKFF